MSTGLSSRAASSLLICLATSVEPVKITPLMRSSDVKAAPTSPAPKTSCKASLAHQTHVAKILPNVRLNWFVRQVWQQQYYLLPVPRQPHRTK